MLRTLKGPHYLMAARRFAGSMCLPSDGEALKAHVESVMSSPPRHVLLELTRALMAWDGPPALARLNRPLLYIGSRRPLTGQADLLAASPWVQYSQATGSGHFLTLVVPQQINAMIQRCLRCCPTRRQRLSPRFILSTAWHGSLVFMAKNYYFHNRRAMRRPAPPDARPS